MNIAIRKTEPFVTELFDDSTSCAITVCDTTTGCHESADLAEKIKRLLETDRDVTRREALIADSASLQRAITTVAEQYSTSAPTVESWCDWLAGTANADQVTMSDLKLLEQFLNEDIQGNFAANMLYKHQARLGRDTTGHAGF